MKKLLSLLFCLMAVHVSTAQTADFSVPNSDGVTLYYNITDATQHTVEVTNYYGQVALASLGGTVSWGSYIRYTTPVLRVPSTVVYAGKTYMVTKVGKTAFAIGTMTQVVLPNTIKELGDYCFYSCDQLTSVNLPEGITSIGHDAFHGTFNLHSVTLPSTLKTAGEWTFRDSGIEYIYNLENTQLTELPVQFAGMNVGLKEVKLPQTLRKIGAYSLMQSRYTEITIPAGVEQIDAYALMQVFTLKKVVMERATPPLGCGEIDGAPDLKIYVPIDATQPYEAASQWSNYPGKYYEQVPVGPTGYTSYYLENENFLVPSGCTAYIITGITPSGSIMTPDQAQVTAFTAGKIIPKQTGFILQGTPSSTIEYQANVTGTEENVTGNLLIGTATEQEFNAAGYKYYIFSNNGDEGIGFYKQGTRNGASIKLAAHRAGLRLPEAIAPAKGFTIDFESARKEAETTGIRDVRPTAQPRENVIYDLQGRRVMNPGRGIYIVNGKKVVRE